MTDERTWPVWAQSTAEQAAESWLERHDEDGHDYLDDYLAAEGHYGDDDE